MATLITYIRPERAKKDGTVRVYFRLTHERKVRLIPTEMYVEKRYVTASGEIRDNEIAERCDEKLYLLRKRLYELNLEVNEIPIDEIIAYLSKKQKRPGISFTDWANEWIAKKAKTSAGAAANYKTALRAFSRMLGAEQLMMTDISVKNLQRFAESLEDKPRAASLYCSAIVKMFNDAKEHYNDEDNGHVVIKQTLRKFKMPKQNVADKRALSADQIRAIFELSYDNKAGKFGNISLHDLALDCFKLSFCLMGMNSADLYNAKRMEGDTIIYERTKTRARRSDKAEMHVRIHPYIAELVEKYRGKEHVFNFCERYGNLRNFNSYVNRGLKAVGEEAGIEGLQFYAARHSMATIAANDCGIDIWTVNLMLCHTAPQMKMTELYIKKDYSQENLAMAKVLDYILG